MKCESRIKKLIENEPKIVILKLTNFLGISPDLHKLFHSSFLILTSGLKWHITYINQRTPIYLLNYPRRPYFRTIICCKKMS
jgi:hypothetical protein